VRTIVVKCCGDGVGAASSRVYLLGTAAAQRVKLAVLRWSVRRVSLRTLIYAARSCKRQKLQLAKAKK